MQLMELGTKLDYCVILLMKIVFIDKITLEEKKKANLLQTVFNGTLGP